MRSEGAEPGGDVGKDLGREGGLDVAVFAGFAGLAGLHQVVQPGVDEDDVAVALGQQLAYPADVVHGRHLRVFLAAEYH